MTIPDFYKSINKKYNFTPSHYELSKHLFLDTLIFTAIYFSLKSGNTYLYLAAQLLWPVLFFRFFSLMHDGVHSSISRKSRINNFLGYIAGAFCFLPFYSWRKIHLQHHYWAGNVENDPVMKIIRDYNPEKKIKNSILGFAWKSWIPILATMQHVVFWIFGFAFFKAAKTWKSKLSWALSYVIPGLIYYQLNKMGMFTFTNVAPGLFIYLIMVEVINFPHHLELPQNHGETVLPVWEQYQISRSCSYPKWFSTLILNNFNYHSEHHMFPKAPWYMLQKVSVDVRQVIGEGYNHSNRSEWILRNRTKNLGDLLIYKKENESPLATAEVKSA